MSLPLYRWAHRAGFVLAALLILVGAVVLVIELPPVATWLGRKLLALAPLSPGYRLAVGRVSGDWLHGLVLRGVRLTHGDRELAVLDRVALAYDPRRIAGGGLRIDEIDVDGARITASRGPGGWDIAGALRRSTSGAGGGTQLTVDRLSLNDLDAAAFLSPDSAIRARSAALRARHLTLGPQTLLGIDQLTAAVSPPGSRQWFSLSTRGEIGPADVRLDPLRLSSERSDVVARLVMPRTYPAAQQLRRLDVRLRAEPLALADLAAIVPSVRPDGALRLEASARGGRDSLITSQLAARLGDAVLRLDGSAALERGRPAAIRVRGTVRGLDPSRILRGAGSGDINAELAADVAGASPRSSTGTASLRLTDSRIGGRALDRVDLRTRLDSGRTDLSLVASAPPMAVRVRGWARPFDSLPTYHLGGSARGLPGTGALARALSGRTGRVALVVDFRLDGSGVRPGRATASGSAGLVAVPETGEPISLGGTAVMLSGKVLEARPRLVVGGGTVSAVAVARLGDTLSFELRRGRIDSVDVGRLRGDTLIAPLTGRFTLRGRGIAPASAIADGRIELGSLQYGSLRLDALRAIVGLDRGRARLNLRGALRGGRITVDAEGRPFDSTAAFTVRRATVDSVDLGTLLGRPSLAGPVSLTANASGRSDGRTRALRGTVALRPSRLGQVAVVGGRLAATMDGAKLSFSGSLASDAGALSFTGEGATRAAVPSFSISRGRVDSLDLAALLGRPALRTNLNATLSASVRGTSMDSAVGRVTLGVEPSRVRGAEIRTGRVALQLDGGALRGNIGFDGPDGELAATLRGRNATAVRELGLEGTLRLEHLARWTGDTSADGRFESRFALDGLVDSLGLRSLGGTLTGSGGVGGVRLDPLHVALRPDSGAIHIDTLIVRSNVALLDGAGRVPLRDTTASDTLHVDGMLNDPAPLSAFFGDTVSLDSARVALALTGSAIRRALDGRVDAHRVFTHGTLAERVTLDVTGTTDHARMSGLAGELTLRDGVSGRWRVPTAHATIRYDSTLALDLTANINDSVPVAASVRGTARPDSVRATIERLDLGAWSLARPAVVVARPRVQVDSLVLQAADRRLVIDGVLDRHGPSDLSVDLHQVDLDLLRELELSPIPGRVDGRVRLAGTAELPRVEGDLALTVRDRTGADLGVIRTGLRWGETGLQLDAAATPRQGGQLTLRGSLPVRFALTPADTVAIARSAADSVSLALQANRFDLGFIESLLPPETARDLGGRLELDARVGGSLGKPHASGSFSLDSARVTLPALGTTYQGGRLAGRIDGDHVEVSDLELLTGKNERLAGRGTVLLTPLDDPKLDLAVTLRDFRLSNSDQLRAVASGQVRLAGTLAAPEVTGQLRLGRTDVFTGAEAARAQVEEVILTPADRRMLAREFGPAAIQEARHSPGLVERTRLDVGLELPGRVWIRRRETPAMDIELSGRMRLRQDPGGQMQFFGQVEPVANRSTLEVSGREFLLTSGTIRLNGPVEQAHLDVNAEYQVPVAGSPDQEPVVVQVNAVGRPDSLALTFTSDPTMSQEDILSYIVTGRPAADNPLTAQQASGGNLGKQIALGQLSQAISSRAGEGLGFDVFQIRQEGTRGLTLTAGRYLGSKLFVDLQLPLQILGTASQLPGVGLGPGFEADYAFYRWLRAGLSGGSLPTGFRLRGRHAY